VIRDAVTYTEHAKRKTVTSLDVVYALKRQVPPNLPLVLCKSLLTFVFRDAPFMALVVRGLGWYGSWFLINDRCCLLLLIAFVYILV
jgi:hypothetical protein